MQLATSLTTIRDIDSKMVDMGNKIDSNQLAIELLHQASSIYIISLFSP